MNTIITTLDTLTIPVEPLKFVDNNGTHKEEGLSIIAKIKDVMEADKTILALAAPQIGINKRIFCIRFGEIIKSFINPIITKKNNYEISVETCASMPGKEILITRPEDITVVYYNDDFKYEDNKLLGAAARVFDQQAQILDGVLPNELGLVSDIVADGTLTDLSEAELKEVIEIYKQFIAVKTAKLQEAIKQDDTISEQYRRMKFAEDVINDRIQVVDNSQGVKMNRAQRRAAEKMSKQIKTKKAGK